MRLEHLCDMELAYRSESLYQSKFVVARPYDSQEASAYGEGDGWVKERGTIERNSTVG